LKAFCGYTKKCDEFKIRKDSEFVDSIGKLLRTSKVLLVTAIVMKAHCDGLAGIPLRNKMLEAQKLLKASSIPPGALLVVVKQTYMEGISMQ
jgi:hypothetical protein